MPQANALLAINSLDRYNKNQGPTGQFASFSASLENQYNKTGQPCNNFQVGGFGALIYGYIKYIIVSQTQFEYNVPTVVPGQNDKFLIIARQISTGNLTVSEITIPFGYYTPAELASIMEIEIDASTVGSTIGGISVIYRTLYNDFVFGGTDNSYQIYFPDIDDMKAYILANNLEPNLYINYLKAYRLIGLDITNSSPAVTQDSAVSPQFLYTPYVDIFSTSLTKYQRVKDNTTSASSDSTLVARIFLSGEGTPQNTAGEGYTNVFPGPSEEGRPVPITNYAYPLGSRPFIVVQDANSPKVIRWSREETVYALDFQLRDQYGDLLFTQYGPYGPGNTQPIYFSEFQMTLMCVEGERA